MGRSHNNDLPFASVIDFNVETTALLAFHSPCQPRKAGMWAALWNAGIDLDVDTLTDLILLDGSLWWGGPSFTWFIPQLVPCSLQGSVGAWHCRTDD